MVAAVEKTISKEHYNMGVAYLQSPEALAAVFLWPHAAAEKNQGSEILRWSKPQAED